MHDIKPGRLVWLRGRPATVERVTPTGRFRVEGHDYEPTGRARGAAPTVESLRPEHAVEMLGRPLVTRCAAAARLWQEMLAQGPWAGRLPVPEYRDRVRRALRELTALSAELDTVDARAAALVAEWRAAGHMPPEVTP